MNRGSSRWFDEIRGSNYVTSMRPRFMNRGSLPASGTQAKQSRPTSMRPRFMNRGSGKPSRQAKRAPMHFNEAPIHESGKWAAYGSCRGCAFLLQ